MPFTVIVIVSLPSGTGPFSCGTGFVTSVESSASERVSRSFRFIAYSSGKRRGLSLHSHTRGYACERAGAKSATMKTQIAEMNPAADRARQLRTELARRIASFTESAENRVTDIPGLTL